MQVFDLPTFSMAVTEYQMMRRRCGCEHATTADPPAGVRGGPTCYGPNVTAAATLLASQDVLGIERTADLMSTLLGVAVSTGFISSCLTRLDDALTTAGFEETLKAALRAQDVLGTDETPAPLTATACRQPPPRSSFCRDHDFCRGRWQRLGLPQPARVHRAHDAGLHRRRAGPGLVRRGR